MRGKGPRSGKREGEPTSRTASTGQARPPRRLSLLLPRLLTAHPECAFSPPEATHPHLSPANTGFLSPCRPSPTPAALFPHSLAPCHLPHNYFLTGPKSPRPSSSPSPGPSALSLSLELPSSSTPCIHSCLLPIPGCHATSLSEPRAILNAELPLLFTQPLSDRIRSPFTVKEPQILTSLLPMTPQVTRARPCSDMGKTVVNEMPGPGPQRAATSVGGGVGLEKDKKVNKKISEKGKCYKESKARMN